MGSRFLLDLERRGVCEGWRSRPSRCPGAVECAKVLNSAVFARKFEALVSKAEFTAAVIKLTYIANFDGRLGVTCSLTADIFGGLLPHPEYGVLVC